MKKIPESYELNEEDIKEAIAQYICNEHQDMLNAETPFKVTINVERKQIYPKTGPYISVADTEITIVSATAIRDE
jgi:hypothetical protein